MPQDPASFETILSGDLADDDVALGNGTGENAYHVLSLIGCDADVLVDGVVIEAGNANAGSATCEDLVRDDWGGGVYISHDFGLDESPCLGVIQNCLIRRNEATDGGGLLVNATRPCEDAVPSTYVFPAARPSIRTTEVSGNASGKGGSGMLWTDAAPEAAGCVVVDNYSQRYSSIYILRPLAIGESAPPARLINCTVAYNRNDEDIGNWGAGILVAEAPGEDTVLLESCIVTNNVSGDDSYVGTPYEQIAHYNGNTIGMFSYVINNSDVANIPSASWYGANNIGATDPGFVDQASGNYRLVRCSPCIDSGTSMNTVLPADAFDADYDEDYAEKLPDRDRSERIINARVDMGAFESGCIADLDADGTVGSSDLAILLGEWGSCGGSCVSDLDCSGDVGASDLATLLGSWGCASAGFGAGFMAEGGAENQSMTMSFGDPASLASLFGFESVEGFADWLGTLSANDRNAILLGFIGGEL